MSDAEFAERVLAHLPQLRAYARCNMPSDLLARESCSDITQSMCRELIERRPQFEWRGPEAFRAWLFRYCVGKIRDRAKYHRRECRALDREESMGMPDMRLGLDRQATPSTHAIAGEQSARIEQAFERLRPDDREVITLCSVLGLPRDEVAAILGKSEGSVRTQLHRAKARLAAELDHLGIEP